MAKHDIRVVKMQRELEISLSEFLQAGKNSFGLEGLTSITRVELARDLKAAKCFISVYPEEFREANFKILKNKKRDMQKWVADKLAFRYTPVFELFLDKGLEKADQLHQELKGLALVGSKKDV